MLKNNDFMFTQQVLLVMNIDKKIGIVRIKIVHSDMFELIGLL